MSSYSRADSAMHHHHPPGSELVTDADEEVSLLISHTQLDADATFDQVFVLYTELQANIPSHRGLGYVNSHRDVLEIIFELKTVHKIKKDLFLDKTIEIELFQDKTALRTRKGDTGSVLWKARSVCPKSRFRMKLTLAQVSTLVSSFFNTTTQIRLTVFSIVVFLRPNMSWSSGLLPRVFCSRRNHPNLIKTTALALVC